MKKAILAIYDFLSGRKGLAALILAVLTILSVIPALRMHYNEDISAFLPQSEETARIREVYSMLGSENRIAVLFSIREGEEPADTAYTLMNAMDSFASLWEEADTARIISSGIGASTGPQGGEVLGFITSKWPYFLERQDFERIDSLMSEPGFITEMLQQDRQALFSPVSGPATQVMRADPLGLFSPVLRKLSSAIPQSGARIEDGYLFTPDGSTGIIFFNSPFGGGESGNNALLASLVRQVSEAAMEENPEVSVSATGGPLVAVENASRIKKDSILAISLALVLILIVLHLSFKRVSDVVWIMVSILCGALFALGLIALFKRTVSVIVLGIGSMIIGIAANYPLHYVDHLKFQKDRRKALKDQIMPLLVGNVTTVGAFLSLMLLKADAMHEFGFIGAMTLVGTIVFVLVFLPVFIPGETSPRQTLKLDLGRFFNPGKRTRGLILTGFLLLTAFLAWESRKTSFDADLHNINYMTPSQEKGFEVLSTLGENPDGTVTVYAVAEGDTPDHALEANRMLLQSLPGDAVSIAPLLPSRKEQEERLTLWDSFRKGHQDDFSVFRREAASLGFAEDAFGPFLNILEKNWKVQEVSYFEPVTSTVGASMFFPGEGRTRIVNRLLVNPSSVGTVKAASVPEGCFVFSASDAGSGIVSLLGDDFNTVGTLCSAIVFIFLVLSLGSLELAIMAFLPLAAAWVWILGMMHLGGISFNIVNIILATFIFGQGDDYTIFITEGLIYERATGKKILHSWRNTVVLSALIMFIGIGSLIVSRHPAMRSLGQVTVIGMFAVVVMACYLPPVVFRFLTRKNGEERVHPLTAGSLVTTGGELLLFLLAMLVLTPAAALLFLLVPRSEKRNLFYHKAIQNVSRFALRCLPGGKYKVYNPYGEDFTKPAVITCNHQSHLDVLSILALTPKVILLTNDWVWNNPFYGYLIHKAEFYPISKGYSENLDKLRDLVARGYSIAVFPEGTRSPDCSIQRFHRGVFLMARDLGLDILPLCIHGFGYMLPKRELSFQKACISLEIGQRRPFNTVSDDLKAEARSFRQHYIRWYEGIRVQRETPSYNAPIVRSQYLYKGSDSAAEVRKYLKKKVFQQIEEIPSGTATITVTGSGCGVFALLLALSRKDIGVFACEMDEEKHLTALRCSLVPGNLHHILLEEGAAAPQADLTIAL
ncbi:MAG: 1-acyl-sn-glycerol-3-phosphate acyltransferase [Bacteroidales bacterium]|nr:1-acyl-sn-glycerol-3-phosphate acyltransferase [Bacteroidales bacterium]